MSARWARRPCISAGTDDRVIAAEVAQYRPDLLVVAYGTNEAFMPGFTASGYASRLRAAIGRLKRLFPGVPVLMLGAAGQRDDAAGADNRRERSVGRLRRRSRRARGRLAADRRARQRPGDAAPRRA